MTLIELILGMAIVSIICIAIGTLMQTGTRSYKTTTDEVDMQYEAQLASNQINNMLVDATVDVTFALEGDVPIDTKEDPVADDVNKYLIVETSEREVDNSDPDNPQSIYTYVKKQLSWHADEKKLYYGEGTASLDAEGNPEWDAVTLSAEELLADKVESFTVDFSDKANGNIKVYMYFKNASKGFNSDCNLTLRNNITFGTAIASPSEGGTGTVGAGGVTGVVVNPSILILEPGQNATFVAVVKGTGLVDQSVTWSFGVHQPEKAGTSINPSTGRVVIAEDETASTITVVATSVADNTKSGMGTIAIKKVGQVRIVADSTEVYRQNAEFGLKAIVTGTGISSANPDDQAVKWTITEGAGYITQMAADAEGYTHFRIAGNTPVGTVVTFVATSVLNNKMSDSKTITVEKAEKVVGDDDDPDAPKTDDGAYVSITDWPGEIKRGGSGTWSVKKTDPEGKYYVAFEVSVLDENGDKVAKSSYSTSTSGTSCTVSLFKSYKYSKSGQVRVTAHLVPNGKTIADSATGSTKTASIYEVSLGLAKTHKADYEKNIDGIKIFYRKSGETKVYYELKGIEDEDVDWKKYDTKIVSIKQDSGYFSLSMPNYDKTGVTSGRTVAHAYLGSYDLKCSMTVEAAAGNVKFWDPIYKEQWAYIPTPDDDEFGSDDYPFSETKGKTPDQYTWKAASPKNYFKIPNMAKYYVYYWYNPWLQKWAVKITDSFAEDGSEKYYYLYGQMQFMIPSSGTVMYFNKNRDTDWTCQE